MKNVITKALYVLAIIFIIWAVSQKEDKPSPVEDCYLFLWGDSYRMEMLGLENLSAMEVYEFCRTAIINEDPILTQGDAVRPIILRGEPIIETVETTSQIETMIQRDAGIMIEPTIEIIEDGERYTLDKQETP